MSNKTNKTKKAPKVQPLGDRVLIKIAKDTKEKKTASGIIIPGTISEDSGSKRGEVVAVGDGKYESGKLIKPSVNIGDNVLFTWGDEITIDGEDYYMVVEANILAIIK